jgi:hypothetical protein
MNPWYWMREHKLALVVVSALGAVLGLMIGFIKSPFFSWPQVGQGFATWLIYPESYWPWPLSGFLITGLIFCAVQLFRSSN